MTVKFCHVGFCVSIDLHYDRLVLDPSWCGLLVIWHILTTSASCGECDETSVYYNCDEYGWKDCRLIQCRQSATAWPDNLMDETAI